MEDTGGKSGRRSGRHLQVEAFGPANATSVQQRLASRFGGNLTWNGGCAGPGSEVDAPEVFSGPGWNIQEVSRVGAQGVTSKSKLLDLQMPRVCSRGLWADFEAAKLPEVAFGCRVLPEGAHTPRPDLVVRYSTFDRVCAQSVTSASLVLSREATQLRRRLRGKSRCKHGRFGRSFPGKGRGAWPHI